MRNSKRKYVGTGGTRAGYERGREKVFGKGWTGLAGLTQRNSSSRPLLALREMTNCFDKDFIEIIWAVLAHGSQLCAALCRKTWDQQSKCVCVFSCLCFCLCVTVSIPVGRRWDQQSAIELTAEGDGQPISTQLALNI